MLSVFGNTTRRKINHVISSDDIKCRILAIRCKLSVSVTSRTGGLFRPGKGLRGGWIKDKSIVFVRIRPDRQTAYLRWGCGRFECITKLHINPSTITTIGNVIFGLIWAPEYLNADTWIDFENISNGYPRRGWSRTAEGNRMIFMFYWSI